MGEANKQGGDHLGVADDLSPFAEAKLRGDHDAGALLELAQQLEEERPARIAEVQASQLIQNIEVELGNVFRDMVYFTLSLFPFDGVNQFDCRVEPNLSLVMFDRLDAVGGGRMGCASADPTDQPTLFAPFMNSQRCIVRTVA